MKSFWHAVPGNGSFHVCKTQFHPKSALVLTHEKTNELHPWTKAGQKAQQHCNTQMLLQMSPANLTRNLPSLPPHNSKFTWRKSNPAQNCVNPCETACKYNWNLLISYNEAFIFFFLEPDLQNCWGTGAGKSLPWSGRSLCMEQAFPTFTERVL